MGHTKGGWKVIARNQPSIFGNEIREVVYRISDSVTTGLHITDEETANARLIAAAPGLLEACNKLAMLGLQSTHYQTDIDFREAVDNGIFLVHKAQTK